MTPINKSKKAGHTLVLAVGGKAAAPWVAPTRSRQLRAAERLPGHVREETLLEACHSGGRPSDRDISRSSIRPVGHSIGLIIGRVLLGLAFNSAIGAFTLRLVYARWRV